MSNNPEVVESLIAAGAKVNYQYDRINDTLAHISIKKGNAKLLNILLRLVSVLPFSNLGVRFFLFLVQMQA